MKKSILIVLGVLLCFGLAACTEQKAAPIDPEQSSGQEQTPPQRILTTRSFNRIIFKKYRHTRNRRVEIEAGYRQTGN